MARYPRKTVFVDSDVLILGGGFGGCGAAYESRYWGRNAKIVLVEKANIERSGAVAHGLSAINCYMGMRWNENRPEDHVRYARGDLLGLTREDLGYDIARHVDSTVHKFEEWGLPIMKNEETGRYLREGKWQIMIHGESYKPIIAEAARKAATDRRRGRLRGPGREVLRLPREDGHRGRGRCLAHLSGTVGRRRPRKNLVRPVE
jgi:adenylylsulfate reductase subunit A